MNVSIITEGGKNIGFGHLTRCLSLYQAFEEKEIVPLLIVNGGAGVEDFFTGKKVTILNWLDDNTELWAFIEDADIAIIDSYLAPLKLYKEVSKIAAVPVYIDDTKRIDYPNGVVVNGSFIAEELNYPRNTGIDYLIGSQYIPLRKEFWEVEEKKIEEKIGSVLVTFGGTDLAGMTPKVLELLIDEFPAINKKIIVSKDFYNTELISAFGDFNTEFIYNPSVDKLKTAMLDCDIAISSAGQTLYELARMGTPVVTVAVVENQLNNVRGWEKVGFIQYAGWWQDELVFSNIIRTIKLLDNKDLRLELSKKGRDLVDGKGSLRIVDKLIEKLGLR